MNTSTLYVLLKPKGERKISQLDFENQARPLFAQILGVRLSFAGLITHKELGLYALIGIVLLMGLVSKNSILLVDYALLNQKEGKSTYRAVLDSGVARLRPILMTTIAMIAGMLPIALGVGAGSELRSPMAIAVIGGLATSTLLTLVVVPVIFTYIDSLQDRLSRTVFRRAVERQAEEEPERSIDPAMRN